MSLTINFIKEQIEKQLYTLSLHADEERIADKLSINELENILVNCKIIEEYPTDPRGESCLVVGILENNIPVHVVCGKNRNGNLVIITVYLPKMPKWLTPYQRSRGE